MTYDDCSFMLLLPDKEIDPGLSPYIKECNNVLYFLPVFDDSIGHNVSLLKKSRHGTVSMPITMKQKRKI